MIQGLKAGYRAFLNARNTAAEKALLGRRRTKLDSKMVGPHTVLENDGATIVLNVDGLPERNSGRIRPAPTVTDTIPPKAAGKQYLATPKWKRIEHPRRLMRLREVSGWPRPLSALIRQSRGLREKILTLRQGVRRARALSPTFRLNGNGSSISS